MLKNCLRKLIFASALLGLMMSCATTEDEEYTVEFSQEVKIISEDNKVRKIKKGKPVTLSGQPITATRKNGKPMILLPLPQDGGTLKVFVPPEDPAPLAQSTPVICPPAPAAICPSAPAPDYGAEFNKVGQSMVTIQNLLGNGSPDEALAQIANLRAKYPSFNYIRFLEASAYVVKRDLPRARTILEQALKDFPDDSLGQELLKSLNASKENSGLKPREGQMR